MTQLGLDLLLDSLGQIPKSFVPPGHQVDTTSYRVLVDNNFEFLSSNGVTKSYIFPDSSIYATTRNIPGN